MIVWILICLVVICVASAVGLMTGGEQPKSYTFCKNGEHSGHEIHADDSPSRRAFVCSKCVFRVNL